MPETLTTTPPSQPTEKSSGTLFSGIIESITHRTNLAINNQSSPQASFINHHANLLNDALSRVLSASSPQELIHLAGSYREHLASIVFELQKITYDRDRHRDLFSLSATIAGNRGGIWAGEKDDKMNDFGHSHLFVESMRVKSGNAYNQELREISREILDISDLIVLHFLRFIRINSNRIENQKNIIIQEIIHTEQFMLSRRLTLDESKELLTALESLIKRAPQKIQQEFGQEFRGYFVANDGNYLATPKIGLIKELVEKLKIIEVDDTFTTDAIRLSKRIFQLLEECNRRLPHGATIDSIKKSVVCFYNGISPYREIHELEKGVRSTPLDSPFSPETKIAELSQELEQTSLEIAQAGYESLGISIELPRQTPHDNPNLKNPAHSRMYIIMLGKRHSSILGKAEHMTPGDIVPRFRSEYGLFQEICDVEEWFYANLSKNPKKEEDTAVLSELAPLVQELSLSKPVVIRRLLNVIQNPELRVVEFMREYSVKKTGQNQSTLHLEFFRIQQDILWSIQKTEKWHAAKLTKSSKNKESAIYAEITPVISIISKAKPALLVSILKTYERLAPGLQEIINSTHTIAGKDADIRSSAEQFKIEWGLINEIRNIENWCRWSSTSGDEENATQIKEFLGKLQIAKSSLTRESINRFIKTASANINLVWENPVLSNTFHDIILFASRVNLLSDNTTISLILMIKKEIPQSKEGVAYIRAILRSILKGPLALQSRSMTKNNVMHVARDWSTFCGFDYMLYIELVEWLAKNCILHQDTESDIIGGQILETIRRFQPEGTMEHQDAGRVKGRLYTLQRIFECKEYFQQPFGNMQKDKSGEAFRHKEAFQKEPIEKIIARIGADILFNQFEIKKISPQESTEEDFFTGELVTIVAFPQITSPYFIYYNDSLAFEFIPKDGINPSIDGVFWQSQWLMEHLIKAHQENLKNTGHLVLPNS